jgi:hypothetical protein
MRRIAIGLVKFGLKEFFVPSSNFGGDRVRSTAEPVQTLTTESRGEGFAEPVVAAFQLTSNKGFDCGVRGLDSPTGTITCNSRGEGLVEPAFIIPNFGERPGQEPRTHSLDGPVPAATSHGAGGLCEAWLLTKQGLNPHMNEPRSADYPIPAVLTDGRIHLCEAQSFLVQFAHGSAKPADCERRVSNGDKPLPALETSNSMSVVFPAPFILPKDQGHKADYVIGVDQPCPAVQTTSHDHLAEPCIIQMNGCSTAICGLTDRRPDRDAEDLRDGAAHQPPA